MSFFVSYNSSTFSDSPPPCPSCLRLSACSCASSSSSAPSTCSSAPTQTPPSPRTTWRDRKRKRIEKRTLSADAPENPRGEKRQALMSSRDEDGDEDMSICISEEGYYCEHEPSPPKDALAIHGWNKISVSPFWATLVAHIQGQIELDFGLLADKSEVWDHSEGGLWLFKSGDGFHVTNYMTDWVLFVARDWDMAVSILSVERLSSVTGCDARPVSEKAKVEREFKDLAMGVLVCG